MIARGPILAAMGRGEPSAAVVRRLGGRLESAADIPAVGLAVLEGLASCCGFDHICIGTVDPDTCLVTSHYQTGNRSAVLRPVLEHEYTEPDVNKFSVLSRRADPVAMLSESTGGLPHRSARYRDLLQPLGYADEVRVALTAGGALWGFLSVQRREGPGAFRPGCKALLHSASALLALSVRRLAMATAGAGPGDDPEMTGTVVVDADGHVLSASARGERLLRELGPSQRLPAAVDAAVAVARAAPSGESPRIRVRCPSGRWLTVSASRLSAATQQPQFAVLLGGSNPAELATLLFQAHELTAREMEVATAVWQHLSTQEIAARLFISGYTVQDHLKSIFLKMEVSSRRQLVAKIFAEGGLQFPPGPRAARRPG
jgi:DNA-binding CsgD family transcriptional regulator